jgi:hypothetical protein
LTRFRFPRDLGLLGVASLSPVAERGLGSFTPTDDGDDPFAG